ncbi:MAG TPA: nitrate reductase molybdenum cofactor assembly chaperone [Dongiaceae bacterium]|nr:nitrate reductase molybdenum cofactor assembly chaperone [Dongiaceae bacterium]
MLELRALGALLSYPTAELREALPEIAEAIRRSPLIAPRERAGLDVLLSELAGGELMTAEERYVGLFDASRAASLNLFEHLHGDSRDRGTAMVDLKRIYARAGFELATSELPDYLPVLLEYLSCRDLPEARAMLADCAHILRAIATALIARGSAYAAVLQALIVIAGEAPVDAAAVRPVREQPGELDRDWAEQPAFAEVPLAAIPGRPRPR